MGKTRNPKNKLCWCAQQDKTGHFAYYYYYSGVYECVYIHKLYDVYDMGWEEGLLIICIHKVRADFRSPSSLRLCN